MNVGKLVSSQRVQQMAAQDSLKTQNVKPKSVKMQATPDQPAVEVKIGSGLEKTALLNNIYK